MMELCGEILGLLRRGSPGRWLRMTDDVREGVCCFAPLRPTLLLFCHDPCREPAAPDPADVTLDTSDPTGRFHCREWLREQGHDVGSEDRADVLAWSVLSVWRGGPAMPMVAGKWEYEGDGSWARYHYTHPSHQAYPAGCVWPEKGGWRAWNPDIEQLRGALTFGIPDSSEVGEAGKAACDARLLALGWALTNPDGTLTLPPLPGAK